MSIALETSTGNRIQRSGLSHGMTWGSVYDSPESGRPVGAILAGDRRLMADSTPAAKNVVEEREREGEEAAEDSSSSSSIGRNSDSLGGQSDGDGDSGEVEVQSSFKSPLDGLEALEEVLPMKRSMSKFYCGKSKSFTSLADATSCSSIKEIVKPENAYTRKRKNLLAHSVFWDKNRSSPLRSNSWGISKRPTNSNRSTLALAVTMSSLERSNSSECFNSNSSAPTICRPPLYPQNRRTPNNESSSSPPQWNISPWRSFSLSDLQRAAAAETPGVTGKVISNGEGQAAVKSFNL